MSMTAVPISIRLVRAAMALSSGNGDAELAGEVVDAHEGAVEAELLSRHRELDRLAQGVLRGRGPRAGDPLPVAEGEKAYAPHARDARSEVWKPLSVRAMQGERGLASVGRRVSAGCTIGLRNWRSPGMRRVGIHEEDIRAGGPVTVRAALIRHLAGQARGRLVKRLMAPTFERHQEQMRALDDDVEAARRQHPDDREAQQQAIHAVSRDAGVNPLSCCWPAFVPAVIDVLVTLATPRHQSPAPWIAGIVVADD